LQGVVCLAGANACPPEDCGGIGGYYNLLRILADPKHPEHEDMKERVGGKLEAAEFSLDGVNEVFERLKAQARPVTTRYQSRSERDG
jgi:hypothetical protein